MDKFLNKDEVKSLADDYWVCKNCNPSFAAHTFTFAKDIQKVLLNNGLVKLSYTEIDDIAAKFWVCKHTRESLAKKMFCFSEGIRLALLKETN